MSDTLIIPNSIWPNGMKVDSDGYAVFYPLGTNKIEVPTSSEWPKGDKLISPFVYQDNKLVGFVDTKALIVSDNTSIYLPYEHIEAEFSAINKGQLQIHAPNATTKKASWKDSGLEDIPEVQYKYKGCTTVDNVNKVGNYNYLADIANRTWSEPLWDLEEGNYMFNSCSALTAFSSDLPNLTNGEYMFHYCTNLESFNGDLSSLTNGERMFFHCDNLTSFNRNLSSLTNGLCMFAFCYELSAFNCDLPNLTNGYHMFSGGNKLTSFTSDLPNLTDGEGMFSGSNKLTSFNSDLSSLTNGYCMFAGCSLTSWNIALPSLTNGKDMFGGCDNLTSFSSDLLNLTDGSSMFAYCNALASFYSDLSSLTDGETMFYWCTNLESFSSDLLNLTNGLCMFDYCTKLESFNSDLSSLTDGEWMFEGCKLNTASVQNIADTINTPSSKGKIHIGIGNSAPNEQEEAAFNTIASKNWTVYVGVNGGYGTQWKPTSLIPIDGEEQQTPIPFWAKPVQSDEEHAQYIDEQGNYFNILGGNFIYGDDLSTYGMFTCEEDAAANMRLTPYTKPQTKIENQ